MGRPWFPIDVHNYNCFLQLVLLFSFSMSRGHTVKAVCESFQLGKDSGYKVTII